ncbi:ABC transporter ATP-binding protein, partial [Bradyrhizobium sp. UFLA 03-164]|nr:ABC transporter ATP-binding protein [Bradyrhizobium uaiense]
ARPRIMLMDEPFGALDPLTRDTLGDEYRALHRRLALTTVMVTHDMTEALLLADRIAVMRAGRVVAQGQPAELSNN